MIDDSSGQPLRCSANHNRIWMSSEISQYPSTEIIMFCNIGFNLLRGARQPALLKEVSPLPASTLSRIESVVNHKKLGSSDVNTKREEPRERYGKKYEKIQRGSLPLVQWVCEQERGERSGRRSTWSRQQSQSNT